MWWKVSAKSIRQTRKYTEKGNWNQQKQSSVKERLNELEKSHKFLGSKYDDPNKSIWTKYQKKRKTWLKKTCF